MRVIAYIKQNGIKHCWDIMYHYKLQLVFNKIMLKLNANKPLRDIIIIESHNDFDYNGGVFYQYLLEHEYNQKYKIVWMLKNPNRKKLPRNVTSFQIYQPSFRKAYYLCTAKYLFADNNMMPKQRKGQTSVYCTHGPISLKNVRGKIVVPEGIDYFLCPSKFYKPIIANQLMLPYPNNKLICLGFPAHDLLYKSHTNELKKITKRSFAKVILWMPTFRKGGGFHRNDSNAEQPLGIPLINSKEEYEEMNSMLKENNILLIIKIHPMQNKDSIKIKDKSNICVLTGESVKKLNIDNLRLMRETDALISDYSSAAFDYLHLNKPIGYVFSDEADYKLGFVVKDPRTMIAGNEIDNLNDLYIFLQDIASGKDDFKEQRNALFNKLFQYHDGNSCERIIKFFHI